MKTEYALIKITVNPMFGEHTQYLTRNEGFMSILLLSDLRKALVLFTQEQVDALHNVNFLGQASGKTAYYGFEEIL